MHPLKEYLTEQGLSPYDLEYSGVSAHTIYNIISGKHKPTRFTRKMLSDALGVSEYELFVSNENMKAKVYETTLKVLKENPITRSNTKLLVAEVLNKMCACTDLMTLAHRKDAPSIESITRARRSIVEDFPELKGCEDVELQRINNTGSYISFNNYGIMED